MKVGPKVANIARQRRVRLIASYALAIGLTVLGTMALCGQTTTPPGNVLYASSFSGEDMGAKIANALADPRCSNGCVIYDGVAAGSSQSLNSQRNGIVFSRPVTLYLDGQYSYTGPAVPGGLFQIQSSGVRIIAGTYDHMGQTHRTGGAVILAPTAIIYTPSSGTGPVFYFSNPSGSYNEGFELKGMEVVEDANVTNTVDFSGMLHGILLNTRILDNTITNSPYGSCPSGYVVYLNNTTNGPVADRITIARNGDEDGVGCGQAGTNGGIYLATQAQVGTPRIIGNYFQYLRNPFVHLDYAFDALIESNEVLLSHLPSGAGVFDFGPHWAHAILIGNHIENPTANSTPNVYEVYVNAAGDYSIVGNTFGGGTLGMPDAPTYAIYDSGAKPAYFNIQNNFFANLRGGAALYMAGAAHGSQFANAFGSLKAYATAQVLDPPGPSSKFGPTDAAGAQPTTFGSLPACTSGNAGAVRFVSDSTTNLWGARISGGGRDHVLAYCDGANWTVAGK